MDKIKPEFTVAQADAVAIALGSWLEFETENGMECRATKNAINALNYARFSDTNVSREPSKRSSKLLKGKDSG